MKRKKFKPIDLNSGTRRKIESSDRKYSKTISVNTKEVNFPNGERHHLVWNKDELFEVTQIDLVITHGN